MKAMKMAGLVLAASLAAAPALAAPAITFTGGEATNDFPNRTQGYDFTVNSQITITALGFWDQGGDGLNQSHQVGIWSGDGSTLLISAIVPGGTAGTLDSGFRFVSITPFVLNAGTYLAGAFNGNNSDAIIRFTNATTIPEITLGSTRYDTSFSGVFSVPDGVQGSGFDDGYFGPNFMIGNAVPEPASWAMMIGGFAIAGAAMRRRAGAVRYA